MQSPLVKMAEAKATSEKFVRQKSPYGHNTNPRHQGKGKGSIIAIEGSGNMEEEEGSDYKRQDLLGETIWDLYSNKGLPIPRGNS